MEWDKSRCGKGVFDMIKDLVSHAKATGHDYKDLVFELSCHWTQVKPPSNNIDNKGKEK